MPDEIPGHAIHPPAAGSGLDPVRIVRGLLERAPDPAAIVDTEGLLAYVNPAWVVRWGYPDAAAAVGLSAARCLRLPEAAEPDPVMAALRTHDWTGPVVGRRFDGSEVDLICSVHAISADDGRPLCVVARFHGPAAAAAASVDGDLLRDAIVDAAGVLVLVLDHEGRFLRFNAECERVSGWREDEVLGRSPWDTVLPPDEAAAIRRHAFDEVMARGNVDAKHHYVNEWLRRDGARRLIEWTNTLVHPAGAARPVMVTIGVDVTERHAAESALRVREAQLRQAQSVARLGSWHLDLETQRLDWTDQVYRIFEVDPREFAGTYDAFLALVHPDDRTAVDDAYTGSVKTRRPYRIEHRLLMPDGRVKWVEERCETRFNEQGEPVRSDGTVQDITERHRVQAQLKSSAAEMRALLDAFPGAVVCVDDALRYCMVNEGACRIIGRDAAQVLGRTVDEIRGPAEAARLRDINDRLLAGEAVRRELKHAGPDGQVREYLVQYRLSETLDDSGGRRYFAYATDVTESHRNESRLNAIVEATGIGTWEWNLGRDELVVNDQIAALLGYEVSEVPRSPRQWLNEKVHPDDRARRRERFRTVLRDGTRTIDIEARTRHKLGHWIVALERVTVAAVDADGRPTVLFGTAQDVTARRAQEAELRALNEGLEARIAERTRELESAKRDAERANAAKSDFLSRMSHELRTPLNAIVGFGQLLEIAKLPPDEAENVGEITRAGHHLLSLVNEVLDLATVESGQMVLQRRAVALRPLVRECAQLLRPMADEHGIRIENLVDAGCVPVRADRGRLKQVLLNLLSNAIKYNRPRGRVAIECDCSRAGVCELQVKDTGPGLLASQLDRLFQPFERLGPPDQLVQGTGIGLSVSKRLVELMDGSIGAQSSLGEGSTFWVRLPLSGPEDESDSIEPSWPSPGAGRGRADGSPRHVVLYIEDNPANQRLMERFFAKREDIHLVLTADPHAALLMAPQIRPALLLMDIRLPEMDGYELLTRLRVAGIDAPAIAISANAMPADLARGRAAGFSDYLTKPLAMRQVLAVADELLKSPKD